MARTKTVFQAIANTDTAIRRATREAAKAAIEVVQLQFREVVRTWNDKPGFVAQPVLSAKGIGYKLVLAGTEAAKNHWRWTDEGTKAHKIRARFAPRLAFQVGYAAKTAPVAQFNVGNGTSSGAWRKPLEVDHPGTKAREFSATYMTEVEPLFRAELSRNLSKI